MHRNNLIKKKECREEKYNVFLNTKQEMDSFSGIPLIKYCQYDRQMESVFLCRAGLWNVCAISGEYNIIRKSLANPWHQKRH